MNAEINKQQDNYFMAQAIKCAAKAEQLGEVPVGALIVYQHKIIAEGFNQMISSHNACAHAEIEVLQQAGIYLNNYRLIDCTLYVTLEPCMMCAGAMIHARIKRLVYGTTEPKNGAIDSVHQVLEFPNHNHKIKVTKNILQLECQQQLQNFFKNRREQKRVDKLILKK